MKAAWRSLCLASLTAGCDPSFEYLAIDTISVPPAGVSSTVRDDQIRLPEGIAIAVRAVPKSSNLTPYMADDRLVLRAEDDGILDIRPTENDHEFVLIGVAVGATCVEIEIEGDVVECIDAKVIASAP